MTKHDDNGSAALADPPEATDEGQATEAAPVEATPAKPTQVEVLLERRRELESQIEKAEKYHTNIAVALYDAEITVRELNKDRKEAIERVTNLRREMRWLERDEEELKNQPAGLFEAEVAQEWREFALDVAGIDGKLAERLQEAGVLKLGQIAETDLTSIKGIGAEKAAKIADLMAAFFAANPRYVPDAPEAVEGTETE